MSQGLYIEHPSNPKGVSYTPLKFYTLESIDKSIFFSKASLSRYAEDF